MLESREIKGRRKCPPFPEAVRTAHKGYLGSEEMMRYGGAMPKTQEGLREEQNGSGKGQNHFTPRDHPGVRAVKDKTGSKKARTKPHALNAIDLTFLARMFPTRLFLVGIRLSLFHNLQWTLCSRSLLSPAASGQLECSFSGMYSPRFMTRDKITKKRLPFASSPFTSFRDVSCDLLSSRLVEKTFFF